MKSKSKAKGAATVNANNEHIPQGEPFKVCHQLLRQSHYLGSEILLMLFLAN
jgi:hypothetical protein